ncbi:hypothetical protein PMIN06_005481 [Paraphaeosphaeria minitans]
MANSKYGYVRNFELPDNLLPNTFVVVRIDGRGFTKLTTKYNFVKPNDRRALDLMNCAAEAVMKELPDLVLAYGQSDEYSFIFHKDCMLFERRASKLVTTIVSTFTANYVLGWAKHFPDAPLTAPLPSFDGRAVCYPSNTNLRDYLSWRQADCHINNLYNTTFWALVQQGGLENRVAEKELSGTVSGDKNEILFKRFGINYNNEPEIFKKGSVLYRDFFPTSTQSSPTPAKSPIIQHPTPQSIARPMSQPLELTHQDLFRSSPASGTSTATASTPRGPTFLSTSTTPSPPPSPPTIPMPLFTDTFEDRTSVGYPSTFSPLTFSPLSPSANASAPRHATLQPIPLPPPTLKPSTRPPLSLNPPNSITHVNTSPMPSPYVPSSAAYPSPAISNSKKPVKPISHSASASLSLHPKPLAPSYRPSPKRSPSLSVLESGLTRGPPQIPQRFSSIPAEQPPRKLSLPTQKSHAFLRQEASDLDASNSPNTSSYHGVGRPRTPPNQLMTMKELPSPPTGEYDVGGVRGAVMGSSPQPWSQSPPPPPTRGSAISAGGSSGHGAMESLIVNPVIPPSPPGAPLRSHSRAGSSYSKNYSFPAPPTGGREQFASFDWGSRGEVDVELPPEVPEKSKGRQRKGKGEKGKKVLGIEDEGWKEGLEGRPKAMSKTQKEKERKRKGKARIATEHVDIIGDSFWEKRPWILSGRVG